jgi:membrane associated rhomboid family serine protease/pSer/pThr/pTyr-binding forkhead associated (FHA) protein
MFRLHCLCGVRLKLKSGHVGKRVPCPSCKSVIHVVTAGDSVDDADVSHAIVVDEGSARVGDQIFLSGSDPLIGGKLPSTHLVLPGTQVSRSHFQLTPDGGTWQIQDLGSSNGVFVNGERVQQHTLSPGDSMRIGEYKLRYEDARAVDRTLQIQDDPPADDGMMFNLVEEAAAAPSREALESSEPKEPGPICPSCDEQLASGAKICIDCGINVTTGRAMITSQESGLDETYSVAESIIRIASWIIPVGVYPIASEAFGIRKPHIIRAIAVVTIAVSMWFLVLDWTGSPKASSIKNLMLWSGEAQVEPETLAMMYFTAGWGDAEAFEDALINQPEDAPVEDAIIAAHESLTPEQQCLGTYQPSQLLTHALLHGGVLHLLGNLLFLMVFGTRVNALIGGIGAIVVYPILAVAGGLGHMWSSVDAPLHPMLGASGAIMGLAGMYIVLFPAHKVHMAAWWRWGLFRRFSLSLSIFTMRGFWVVAFYIAFDVVFTAMGIDDGTAHWAHLGGFIVGMGIATLLLLSRLINARGGDLFSVLLGRHAWALVGRPSTSRKALLGG